MVKHRIKIPQTTQMQILYKAAKTCTVCKCKDKPLIIHHIDGNPSNNDEENLILLCNDCHDEAHTKHEHSLNMNANRLFFFKNEWENQVKNNSLKAMILGDIISPINWTYFNLSFIPKNIISYGVDYKNNKYYYLISKKIINSDLEIVANDNNNHFYSSTVFDCVNINDAHVLKSFYEEQVNNMISIIIPYEIDAIWTKKEIKSLLRPNMFIYHNGGMYYKTIHKENGIETRKIYMHAKNIGIEGYIYTHYMFGHSSIINSFKRHSSTTGLYFIKNIKNNIREITLEVTPIVLGSGSFSYKMKTPYTLREKIII